MLVSVLRITRSSLKLVVMAETYAGLLAKNLRSARAAADLSQADVAERMRALGFGSWLSQTVSANERARRRVTAEEIAALALCLDTTTGALTAPAGSPVVELPGGQVVSARRFVFNDFSVRWEGNVPVIVGADVAQDARRALAHELHMFAERARQSGADIDVEFTEEEDTATMPPVVAAIVTSELGVLVGRRNDGKPPWTFIAGEQDAVKDENPADTAVREVKEETGLRVTAGDVVGERVHPKTGRTMIYMAAAPTHGTDVFIGDEDELAEVRWVSLAEADELLPGMFEPVREHLARELGEG